MQNDGYGNKQGFRADNVMDKGSVAPVSVLMNFWDARL